MSERNKRELLGVTNGNWRY